eukprot:GHVU01232517.1.p1 GENE.GHVU01232517.1~~GHVU01232517.1.p1  ORF type:complete len:125 (+),score=1.22 GHVU01232517.1:1740-2114(+)
MNKIDSKHFELAGASLARSFFGVVFSVQSFNKYESECQIFVRIFVPSRARLRVCLHPSTEVGDDVLSSDHYPSSVQLHLYSLVGPSLSPFSRSVIHLFVTGIDARLHLRASDGRGPAREHIVII